MAVQALPQPKSKRPGVLALLAQTDIALALVVMLIIVMMVIPLPPALLDMLIALNISMGVTILLVSIYAKEPLDFSVFPTLLLVATLFRLSLNVSSTRLILLQAHAGNIIQSFGQFVIGGSLIVGIVIFLILMVIQFVVITNGAGRVAEVAARFTLDAMPGKQMGVDADLNAGLIDEAEARRRRKQIANEADFYGAMDGASKFVKGDAMAAMLIVAVNIFGGVAVGIFQKGMGITDALSTYSLLTIGEGLVSQIPALLISTATGIIVTRATSEGNLGQDVAQQVFANPRTLFVVSGILGAFGAMPGLPKVPFFAIALVLGGVAFLVRRQQRAAAIQAAIQAQVKEKQEETVVENVVSLLPLDPLEIELGYALLPLVEAPGGGLLERITNIRRQLALELGIIIPTVRVRDNLTLPPNIYCVKLRGVEVGRGEIFVGRYLAMSAGTAAAPVDGISAREPAFGLPATWVDANSRDQAELLGHTVVDPQSVLVTHLVEIFRRHAADLLGRQDVQHLLNNLKADYPAVVEDLTGGLMTLGEIQRVLQNLLQERVSVRDLLTVCETLATHARVTKDIDTLTEQVRLALARAICTQYAGDDRVLHVITLSPRLEQLLVSNLQPTDQGLSILVDPGLANRMLTEVSTKMEEINAAGRSPVLLCSGRLRRPFRRLAERVLPGLAVLAFGEVTPEVDAQAVGMIEVGDG
jgi:flagellar biosynthesis protein FlhA